MNKILERRGTMGKRIMTVAYVIRDGFVLLGLKKVRIGAGLLNGPGGRIEAGETIEEAAIRELFEETSEGIKAKTIRKCGQIDVVFTDDNSEIELHFFLVTEFEGEASESDEMSFNWYPIATINDYFNRMWEGDSHALPKMLAGEFVRAAVAYNNYIDRKLLWIKFLEEKIKR